MFHNNMDLSRLIVHVQKVEDNKKKVFVTLGGLSLNIRQVRAMEAI